MSIKKCLLLLLVISFGMIFIKTRVVEIKPIGNDPKVNQTDDISDNTNATASDEMIECVERVAVEEPSENLESNTKYSRIIAPVKVKNEMKDEMVADVNIESESRETFSCRIFEPEQVDWYKLGQEYYYRGEYERAKEYFIRAVDGGNIKAHFYLGNCFLIKVDTERAKEHFKIILPFLLEQQDAESLYMLGCLYVDVRLGEILRSNKIKAFEMYRQAAEQGYVYAQYNLGLCYKNGCGVDKDAKKSFYWFQLAAAQEYMRAQNDLGWCYENGYGVTKDEKEAFKWYQKAAAQEDVEAQFNLGWCYQRGVGVEKDEKKAVEFYQKAADKGDSDAQFNLGYCYQNGIGVEKSVKKAFGFYQKAADKGDMSAQFYLGWCYQKGVGVEKNDEEAFKFYRMAAIQGYTEAQHAVGVCYIYGRGVSQDIKEAAKWFYIEKSQTLRSEISLEYDIDICEKVMDFFRKLKIIIEDNSLTAKFVQTYFQNHFSRLKRFLLLNGVNTQNVLKEKLQKNEIDASMLNKLLIEAQDAMKCARFILMRETTIPDDLEILKYLKKIIDEGLCLTTHEGQNIILTKDFLRPYVISPWRSCELVETDTDEILANIFGAGFDEDLLYGAAGEAIGENIYDYIFAGKGRFRNRFCLLCESDAGKTRELLAREMHWFRCMNARYVSGNLTAGEKVAFEECKRKVQLYFESATGACYNELADIMIMWAKAIDECEDTMGIGVRVYDQRTFDERFATAYRQYLNEKVLSNEYIGGLIDTKKATASIERLWYALSSECGPEFRNFYRFLVAHLLNVIPTVGVDFAVDQEISEKDMINIISAAIDLRDMSKIAQDIYYGLADEKDAQADECANSLSEMMEKSMKEKFVVDIESGYKVSFKEFCSIVDKTCAGGFETRLQAFLACDFGDMDESARDDMKAWISGEKSFMISELVDMVLNIDLMCNHTDDIPELTRFNSGIGSRGKQSAKYYASVLYPIYLLKMGLIEIK